MEEGRGNNDWFYEDTSLSANMEDYVESIALLSNEKKVVRVKDIAKSLNIKMPSVTNALDKLKGKKLIHYEKYGYIELTEEGIKIAAKIYKKHSCLADFLFHVLRMDKESANKEACILEHHLSPAALKQIHKLVYFFQSEIINEKGWISRLQFLLDERLLTDLKEGDTATIIKINGSGQFRKRLLEMGFRRNEMIKITKYAPLRDPLQLEIKGFQLSLRVDEAKQIIVKQIRND